jgi:lipopolysaccharide assembly outer membrane protein LptD (OstA)
MLGARVCIAACAVVLAATALADPLEELSERLRAEPFELTADALHYDMERELYIGRGDVTIRQAGRTLRSDWVAFNRQTGVGVASGSVELVEGGDIVRADFVHFELDTIQGVVHGGTLESESTRFRASAARIAKTGALTYSFRDGSFTTCRCPDPEDTDPWELRSEEAELEVEGYATARNTTFDIFGVPVAWIPWMVFPVKTERQTGLLFPELSFGSFSGFEIGQPFFWAPRDEVGVVLTPRWSAERGFGGAGLFEYAFDERSGGEALAAYYRDEEIDAKTPDEPFGRNRWSASGAHDLFGPTGLRLQTDYAFASDNEVPFDFRELEDSRSDRFLESHATVSNAFGGLGRVGARAGATFADDLQSPDDLDRDRFLLQRWPTAHVDLLAGGVPGVPFVVPSLEVDYAWFEARDRAEDELPGAVAGPRGLFLDTGIDALPNAREPGPSPDPHRDDFAFFGGSEGDGRYQEGEPLADRGHRLLLHPKLAMPFDWHGISLVPEVGWHQTLYDTRLRDFRQRGFATTRVDLSTRLRRSFGGVVHVLEPRAGYALAYTRSQERNSLLVPATAAPQDRLRALDLDAVTRDDADRIARANRATAGFDNRLYRKRGDGDAGLDLLADFRLLTLYDIEEEALDAVVLDGRALPSERLDVRLHVDLDPDRGRVDEGLAEARWNHPAGVGFDAGYRYARRVPLFFEDFLNGDRFDEDDPDVDHIEQVRGGVSLDLTAQWSVRYSVAHSIEGNRLLANRGAIEYLSQCGCWSMGLELAQDRTRGVDAKLVYRLVGLGGEPPATRRGLLDGLEPLW